MGKNKQSHRTEGALIVKVVIRTDSSIRIGTGHLMRCLTLADSLRRQGAEIVFICRNLEGHMARIARAKDYDVTMLPIPDASTKVKSPANEYDEWLGVEKDIDASQTLSALSKLDVAVDWLIVDHYALDADWERKVQPLVNNIMAIDDLANREHSCDLLLDQNLFDSAEQRYAGLVPESCKMLLGPRYALLRDEFLYATEKKPMRDGSVRRLFVFFGGADPTNETGKTLKAIAMLQRPDIEVEVVIGGSNPHREELIRACSTSEYIKIHTEVDHIAELMSRADIAIGGGGTTTWERCCLGLPSLIISIAENQVEISRQADRSGIGCYLGKKENVTSRHIFEQISTLLNHPEKLRQMSRCGTDLVDGRGTDKVTNCLNELVSRAVTS